MSLYILLWALWLVSDNMEFVSKCNDSRPICFLFPPLKFTQLLFLSFTANPHLDLARTSFPLLVKFSCFTFKEIDINNALFLSMNYICIALKMLKTQFSPPNPLFFLELLYALIEISAQ